MRPQLVEAIRSDTPGIANVNHLMAAGSALMPQPVIDAVVGFTRLEGDIGGYEAQAEKAEELDAVYDSLARLLNANRDEIAVLENATAGWCQAFYSLKFEPGDRVLTSEAEYAANYVAFLQRRQRDGIVIDVIPSDQNGALDVQALRSMIDDRVKLIAITWIPTNGGLVNPAREVGQIAADNEILYLLDACQAVGQMHIDVRDLQCDFLTGTGRKFLRGPRGTGFLFVRSELIQSLDPPMIDHFAAPWTTTDGYELRGDARRFETWENSYGLRAGLAAAIDYALNLGLDSINERAWSLARLLRTLVADMPNTLVRDIGDDQCAIVSFTVDGLDPRPTVAELRKRGINIGSSDPSSTRLDAQRRNLPTVFRAAPHYYNTESEIEALVAALDSLMSPV